MKDVDYWTRLKSLNIMSLQRRRERFNLILIWKIKNNLFPNDLGLQFEENPRTLITKAVIKPMSKVKGKILTAYENFFVIKAAKIWNKLPYSLTKISNPNIFIKKLDEYLALFPDEPPVEGYFHRTTNSLLDYRTVS